MEIIKNYLKYSLWFVLIVFAGTGIKNRRRKLRRQRELDVYFQANKDSIIKK